MRPFTSNSKSKVIRKTKPEIVIDAVELSKRKSASIFETMKPGKGSKIYWVVDYDSKQELYVASYEMIMMWLNRPNGTEFLKINMAGGSNRVILFHRVYPAKLL